MNEADIRKFAQLMKELDLTGLEITDRDQVVRLERNLTVSGVPAARVPERAPVPAEEQAEPVDVVRVTSPLVGLFYTAPAENADPYVSVGDRVQKGQTLCIVEAMKLMNEITADCDGVVEKICAANGQMVEYGTELFQIKR